MNRYAKASSAGSNEGAGKSRGLFRSASAAPGFSGRGAPSARRRRVFLVLATAIALVLVLGVTSASAAAPTVTIENASSVEYKNAHLSGKVDPQGEATIYRFQYTDAGSREFSIAIGSGEWGFAETSKEAEINGALQAVEADLTGLAPSTTYYVRLVAENADGTSEASPASTFTTKGPITPPAVSIEGPTGVTGTTAHFTGHVEPNAPAGNPSVFDVDWQFQCNPGCPGLSGHIAADSSTHTVEADATGLLPGTTYTVSLAASNGGGTVESSTETFSTPALAPQIVNPQAAPDFTEASLMAQINPDGLQTTYHFEYGPTSSYGQSTPAAVIPAGSSPVLIAASISGLSPASGYHYRLVAENSIGSVVSADQTFSTLSDAIPNEVCPNGRDRTGLSALLPDCRAYEQVSPVNKSGNDAGVLNGDPTYAYTAPDGSAVLYGVRGPQGNANRGLEFEAISRRRATGWSSQAAEPDGSAGEFSSTNYVPRTSLPSSDLSKLVFSNQTSLVPANPGIGALYLADTLDESLVWISEPHIPLPPPGTLIFGSELQPAGASPDLSTVYFTAQPALLPEDEERIAGWGLYEYTKGVLRSAGTLPDGTLDPDGAAPANGVSIQEQWHLTEGKGHPEEAANEVSEDGSTLYFVSPDPKTESGRAPQLYVRRDGVSHLVSRSELTGNKAVAGVAFAPSLTQPFIHGGAVEHAFNGQAVYGAADGTIAYFQSISQLTADAPNDTSLKMYRYDVASGLVSYVPGVTGTIVAASKDGQRFLFAGSGEIAVWDHGTIIPIYEGSGIQDLRPAKATPSGSEFVFTTGAVLPGFNNGPGGGSLPIEQIYHYDLASRTTTCVSCPPAGIAPRGAPGMGSTEGEGRSFNRFDDRVLANRGMSEDGKRVFFDTPDPLVPRDTNGRRDVYEWSEGSGTRLISSGKSQENSFFLESSANGDDVFFGTTEGLVPDDTDDEADVYDARVDGGFSSDSEVAACTGEGCQDKTPPPPVFGAPGTSTFSGPGNPPPHAVVKPKAKPLTRAQKLAKALNACHKVKAKRARVLCEKRARHAFGASKSKPKAKSHKGGK